MATVLESYQAARSYTKLSIQIPCEVEDLRSLSADVETLRRGANVPKRKSRPGATRRIESPSNLASEPSISTSTSWTSSPPFRRPEPPPFSVSPAASTTPIRPQTTARVRPSPASGSAVVLEQGPRFVAHRLTSSLRRVPRHQRREESVAPAAALEPDEIVVPPVTRLAVALPGDSGMRRPGNAAAQRVVRRRRKLREAATSATLRSSAASSFSSLARLAASFAFRRASSADAAAAALDPRSPPTEEAPNSVRSSPAEKHDSKEREFLRWGVGGASVVGGFDASRIRCWRLDITIVSARLL
eukprot:CAMPEP_0172542994 /NCGR_PEP_ID=MMETSP1067-20121228/13494_1 /TAXON_ID=265564 ORGANISM="Thalassiosira punctigera, Strain Tpunct2005C2" /NCGR_SAMPLE_ID=MMETSP1067 /ASSEMBLY_ACC=CAM_ASM_000444 /LENGTH=300 /DNA_ID=CAMNT_0013329321 /DNA_START=150 /DNA_END=1055 /DNA_ORIENTATION=+